MSESSLIHVLVVYFRRYMTLCVEVPSNPTKPNQDRLSVAVLTRMWNGQSGSQSWRARSDPGTWCFQTRSGHISEPGNTTESLCVNPWHCLISENGLAPTLNMALPIVRFREVGYLKIDLSYFEYGTSHFKIWGSGISENGRVYFEYGASNCQI